MGGYVVLIGQDALATAKALLKRVAADDEGRRSWTLDVERPDLAVVTTGPGRPAVRLGLDADRLLIGEVFTNSFEPWRDERLIALAGLTPEQGFARLCDGAWGRYVALGRTDTGRWSVFRDPSGGLDCLVWSRRGLQVAASELPGWLRPLLPDGLGVDEQQLARLLAAPTAVQGRVALSGLEGVHPGEMLGDGGGRQLWSPGGVVRRGLLSAAEGLARLRPTVDGCVSALSALHGPAIVEISGGLDSAIVAASMRAAPSSRVVSWSNIYIDDAFGDERAYAAQVADHLGVPLDIDLKPPGRFDPAAMAALGLSARPALAALDGQYDALVCGRARQTGAAALFSGQGGDTVFFNMPTPLLAVDRRRDHGLSSLFTAELAHLARWTQRSVWSLLSRALAPSAGGDAAIGHSPLPFAAPRDPVDRDAPAPHPWLADLADLPPAKRQQIHSLALSQRVNGPAWRNAWVDAIHPLLAQPVVELCLRLSTADLTTGGEDRALARRAFAERIPAAVRRRRGKGDGSRYLGRMIEASLPQLRPLLLDGELARRGLLDRPLLEAMLTPEHLVWRGGYADFLDAATIEVWLRGWTGRSRGAAGAS